MAVGAPSVARQRVGGPGKPSEARVSRRLDPVRQRPVSWPRHAGDAAHAVLSARRAAERRRQRHYLPGARRVRRPLREPLRTVEPLPDRSPGHAAIALLGPAAVDDRRVSPTGHGAPRLDQPLSGQDEGHARVGRQPHRRDPSRARLRLRRTQDPRPRPARELRLHPPHRRRYRQPL